METWADHMSAVRGAVERLESVRVPASEAYTAARLAKQTERKLWKFRLSVESLYMTRAFDVGQLVRIVMDKENRAASDVIADLLAAGALTERETTLMRWARQREVEPSAWITEEWPTE